MKKALIIIAIIFAGIAGLYYLFKPSDKLTQRQFEFVKVERGNVVEKVTATGTIEPINVVSVGTQVSGIIEKVYADYNDEVQKDQLLAELDKFVLNETLSDAKASLDLAQSKKKVAEMNFNRYKDLYAQKLIAKAEMEEAEISLATADANLLSAQANYNKAKQNMDYAYIISPVAGTVISKEVEQGQTVAASFSTPTLFTIAEDLKLMQIEASVSEADIGKIKQDMTAEFTVDAYPTDVFSGKVKQIRLSPITEQNVVMYTVIIEVPNEDKKLLPGMTAFVTILTAQENDVLRIPNTTVQFKPSALLRQKMDGERPKNLKATQAVVYTFDAQKGLIKPHVIELGLIDVMYAQVLEGVQEGEQLISEFISTEKGSAPKGRPPM
ncbi:MAG: efflux RND transporter periplasmic adaptor subunit [Alphaproteobacteria bacterium]|nr:efflux RND transporter periplasmic adaptor subunit [Alphaproteobacteria bacterium]